MSTVKRHPIGVELARELGTEHAADLGHAFDFTKRERVDSLPHGLEARLHITRRLAGYLSVTAPDSPELPRVVRLASQVATAIFVLADATPGTEQEVSFGTTRRVRLPATRFARPPDLSTWMAAFHLACVTRDREALDRLCRVPIPLLRKPPGRGGDSLALAVDVLQRLWRGDQDTAAKLLDAVKAADPSQVEGDGALVLGILVAELELIYRLMLQDGEAFTQMLVTALERHRAYWSEGDRARDPHGYIAWGPLALAALAVDIGLPVGIDSGYLPARLLEGERAAAAGF